MKVPLKWLSDYVNLPKDRQLLTSKLTMAGHMLDKTEIINGDVVIDLELRGNRADCYSIYGIAREVSALFGHKLTPPQSDIKIKQTNFADVKLHIKSKYVKRVMMTTIGNLKIQKSPKWLTDKLSQYGMEPINNIVDLTNFVMIETGQPMHAFDLQKIDKELVIRLAKDKEKIKTFLDNEIELTNDDLVWADENEILSIAGALGSKKHSISANTKTILLEAANYDRANVRRTIHKHNIFTEAGIRHEKELDPNLVELGIKRFLYLVSKHKWGSITTKVFDYYPTPPKQTNIILEMEYLQSLSGMQIGLNTVQEILTKLNFKVLSKNNKEITLKVPTYRTDIEQQEDVIEEILRINGYDQIPSKRLSLEIPENTTPKLTLFRSELKDKLVALGFDEIISLPFVDEINVQINSRFAKPIKIINRPSPNIEFLRTNMLTNLYFSAQKVINERGQQVRMFEAGKVYWQTKDTYAEKQKVGILNWKQDNRDYRIFKGYIDALLIQLGMANYETRQNHTKLLNNSYQLLYKNDIIGFGGEYKDCFYAEFDLDLLLKNSSEFKAALWPKYPPQIEDMTIEIPSGTKIGQIATLINKTDHISSTQLIDIYKNRYTFRIYYQHPDKTLSDKEVEKIRVQIIKKLSQLGCKVS